jgi:hypothetical protein
MVLSLLVEFEATCEHDKIYAGLGLAEKILDPGPDLTFIPDYGWSELFVAVTVAVMKEVPFIPVNYVSPARNWTKS